jgi:hypothetical protein
VNRIPETDQKIKDLKKKFKVFVEDDGEKKEILAPHRNYSLFLNGTHEQTVLLAVHILSGTN